MPNSSAKRSADPWLRTPTGTATPESVSRRSVTNVLAIQPVPRIPHRIELSTTSSPLRRPVSVKVEALWPAARPSCGHDNDNPRDARSKHAPTPPTPPNAGADLDTAAPRSPALLCRRWGHGPRTSALERGETRNRSAPRADRQGRGARCFVKAAGGRGSAASRWVGCEMLGVGPDTCLDMNELLMPGQDEAGRRRRFEVLYAQYHASASRCATESPRTTSKSSWLTHRSTNRG